MAFLRTEEYDPQPVHHDRRARLIFERFEPLGRLIGSAIRASPLFRVRLVLDTAHQPGPPSCEPQRKSVALHPGSPDGSDQGAARVRIATPARAPRRRSDRRACSNNLNSSPARSAPVREPLHRPVGLVRPPPRHQQAAAAGHRSDPVRRAAGDALRAVKHLSAPVITMVHGFGFRKTHRPGDRVRHHPLRRGRSPIIPAKLRLHYNTNGFLNFIGRASARDREWDDLQGGCRSFGGTGAARGIRRRCDPSGRVRGAGARDGADDRVAHLHRGSAGRDPGIHEGWTIMTISPARVGGPTASTMTHLSDLVHKGVQTFLREAATDYEATHARAGGRQRSPRSSTASG